jgi:hypothetical protein
MLNHPVGRKDYVFAPNFAWEFRYNERALVYSGLLVARADFIGGSVGFAGKSAVCADESAADGRTTILWWPKDRPQ